jgi:chaperonin cofactor prefoldin
VKTIEQLEIRIAGLEEDLKTISMRLQDVKWDIKQLKKAKP